MFPYVYIVTDGGPADATTTIDLYIYHQAFSLDQTNLAAAASLVLLALTLLVALVTGLLVRLTAERR